MEHEGPVVEGASEDSCVRRVVHGDGGSNGGSRESSRSRDRFSVTQTTRAVCHADG